MLKNSLIYILLIVLEKGGWLLLLPFYTKYIGSEDFGVYALYGVITSILIMLSGMSLPNALGKVYYDIRDKRYESNVNTYINTIVISVIVASLIISAITYIILSTIVSYGVYVEYKVYILPITLLILFNPFVDIFKATFQIQQLAIYYSITSIFIFIFQTIFTLIFLMIFKMGILSLIYGTIISYFIMFIFGIIFFLKRNGLSFDKDVLNYTLSYSLPLLPHNLSGWLMSSIDRIMIKGLASLSSLGVYVLSFQISSIIAILVKSVNLAWSPYMYKNIYDPDIGRKNLATVAFFFMLIFFAISSFMIIFSKYAIIYFFSNEYVDAVKFIPWLVFVSIFTAANVFLSAPTIVSNPSVFSKITILSSIINVILNYFFIIKFGAIGAVYATLIQKVISTIIYTYIGYRSELKIQFDLHSMIGIYLAIFSSWLYLEKYNIDVFRDIIWFLSILFLLMMCAFIKVDKNDLIRLKEGE